MTGVDIPAGDADYVDSGGAGYLCNGDSMFHAVCDRYYTTEAAVLDDPNNWSEFYDSGSATMAFSGLGGDATRDYIGVLLYKYVDGTDANDIPVMWHEFTAPIPKEATSVTVTWDTEGICQARNAD